MDQLVLSFFNESQDEKQEWQEPCDVRKETTIWIFPQIRRLDNNVNYFIELQEITYISWRVDNFKEIIMPKQFYYYMPVDFIPKPVECKAIDNANQLGSNLHIPSEDWEAELEYYSQFYSSNSDLESLSDSESNNFDLETEWNLNNDRDWKSEVELDLKTLSARYFDPESDCVTLIAEDSDSDSETTLIANIDLKLLKCLEVDLVPYFTSNLLMDLNDNIENIYLSNIFITDRKTYCAIYLRSSLAAYLYTFHGSKRNRHICLKSKLMTTLKAYHNTYSKFAMTLGLLSETFIQDLYLDSETCVQADSKSCSSSEIQLSFFQDLNLDSETCLESDSELNSSFGSEILFAQDLYSDSETCLESDSELSSNTGSDILFAQDLNSDWEPCSESETIFVRDLKSNSKTYLQSDRSSSFKTLTTDSMIVEFTKLIDVRLYPSQLAQIACISNFEFGHRYEIDLTALPNEEDLKRYNQYMASNDKFYNPALLVKVVTLHYNNLQLDEKIKSAKTLLKITGIYDHYIFPICVFLSVLFLLCVL